MASSMRTRFLRQLIERLDEEGIEPTLEAMLQDQYERGFEDGYRVGARDTESQMLAARETNGDDQKE